MSKKIGAGGTGLNSFGSNITLDTFNNRVFKHEVFAISKRIPVAKSGIARVVIDPTENGVFLQDDFVFLPISVQANGGGPVDIDVYAGTDSAADGTVIESLDRNTDKALTAHTVFRLNPTINDNGTKLPVEFCIPSNGVSAVSEIGGAVKSDLILIPRKDIRYMFVFTNIDTVDDVTLVFSLNWFESNK